MTKDDVIRMAREAGGAVFDRDGSYGSYRAGGAIFNAEEFERFAARVAAEAIEKMIPKLADLWDENIDAIMFDDMRREAARYRA